MLLNQTRPHRWLHTPQPVPDTVPQPGRQEMPELPDEGLDEIPPEIIEPPIPAEEPPVGEPDRPVPVRMRTARFGWDGAARGSCRQRSACCSRPPRPARLLMAWMRP